MCGTFNRPYEARIITVMGKQASFFYFWNWPPTRLWRGSTLAFWIGVDKSGRIV